MTEHFYHRDDGKHLRKLRTLQPELFKSFVDFDRKVFGAGALPVKTKELVAVATGHITQCPYCIDVHTKRAAKAGATEAEIAEVIFVAMAMRAAGSWAHSAIAMQALDDDPTPSSS